MQSPCRVCKHSCARCRINKHQEMDDLGATGLRSQDSLGITRARLAKQRLNESTALLDDIKNMEVSPCVNFAWSHHLYATLAGSYLPVSAGAAHTPLAGHLALAGPVLLEESSRRPSTLLCTA